MTSKVRLIVLALVCGLAGPAQADLIAGWDFSQFRGTGLPSTDGVGNTTSLPANYSTLDPTFNAGTESAAFGTATWTGTVLPTSGSLQANLQQPAKPFMAGDLENLETQFGRNPFDSLTILASEGQSFQQLLSLTTQGSSTVTFQATGAPAGGSWSVSFDARALTGSSTIGVDFSTDGSSFSPVSDVMLSAGDPDQRVFLPLGTHAGSTGYVRLSLDDATGQPVIDNVAIAVPEPSMALGLGAGLGVLALLARRRR